MFADQHEKYDFIFAQLNCEECLEWLHDGNRIVARIVARRMRRSVVRTLFIHQMAMMHLCLGRRGLHAAVIQGNICLFIMQDH